MTSVFNIYIVIFFLIYFRFRPTYDTGDCLRKTGKLRGPEKLGDPPEAVLFAQG